MQMNRIRSPYKTTKAVTAYVEQDDGYAVVPQSIKADMTIFAAIADDETRKLNGKPVKAVLFTINNSGWFWMPRSEFLTSTVAEDVKTQTGIPFQH